MKRDKYLNDLKIRMHNGLIKVVTGIRRSGKSYLIFKIFKEYLKSINVDDLHIIEIELDIRENRIYRDPDKILEFIKNKIIDTKNYYILLDEVQMLVDFEEVLNTLLHIPNVDVYVTGSNSKFLSKDIITEFRGRGDEIHIYPFSFKEFMQSYEEYEVYKAWAEYILYGGLPMISLFKTDEQKMNYLKNLFIETYIKDIIERNNVEKVQELNDIINILASSVGSLTNPSKIENSFKSIMHSSISYTTIRQYIEMLKDSFLISEAYRYDVKGRKYIGTPLKYYFEDIGLRNARLNFRQNEETHLMENVIYLELKSRGFQVDVGNVPVREMIDGIRSRKQLEIDFIATLGNKKYYIQSALTMLNKDKIEQEKKSLINIDDSFKKIIIVRDVIKAQLDDKGIVTINLFDFLLNENSLDML